MNTGTRNFILLSNPLKLHCYFIDGNIIFGLICVWTRQILFLLSNVKHELVATCFLTFLIIFDEEKGQYVFPLYSHSEFLHWIFLFHSTEYRCRGQMIFFPARLTLVWVLFCFVFSRIGNPHLHQWCSKGKNVKVVFCVCVCGTPREAAQAQQHKARRCLFRVLQVGETQILFRCPICFFKGYDSI